MVENVKLKNKNKSISPNPKTVLGDTFNFNVEQKKMTNNKKETNARFIKTCIKKSSGKVL